MGISSLLSAGSYSNRAEEGDIWWDFHGFPCLGKLLNFSIKAIICALIINMLTNFYGECSFTREFLVQIEVLFN